MKAKRTSTNQRAFHQAFGCPTDVKELLHRTHRQMREENGMDMDVDDGMGIPDDLAEDLFELTHEPPRTTSKVLETEGYAAIRETSGREWIDMSTFHQLLVVAEEKARAENGTIPQWAKAHPVQRFSEVTITERNN